MDFKKEIAKINAVNQVLFIEHQKVLNRAKKIEQRMIKNVGVISWLNVQIKKQAKNN